MRSEDAGSRVDPGLAVLTRAGSAFGLRFLDRLAAHGLRPALLGVERTTFRARWRMARRLARRIGGWDAARYNARFWWPLLLRAASRGRLHPLPDYAGRAGLVIERPDLHASDLVAALAAPAIDRILLAQSGLVRAPILDLGKRVINCHPARLPGLRGVDVVRWALLTGAPLEVTLHVVDAGVDTGPVIARRGVPVGADDDPRGVERRAEERAVELLVDAALDRRLALAAAEPQGAATGPQVFLMPFATAARLEREWPELRARRLAEGEAHASRKPESPDPGSGAAAGID